jgi:hypothetical protein
MGLDKKENGVGAGMTYNNYFASIKVSEVAANKWLSGVVKKLHNKLNEKKQRQKFHTIPKTRDRL